MAWIGDEWLLLTLYTHPRPDLFPSAQRAVEIPSHQARNRDMIAVEINMHPHEAKAMTMPKSDLKKAYKELYSPSTRIVSQVHVPAFHFAMIDGQGRPDSEEAAQAIQALYSTSYTLKFRMKAKGQDYVVMPLEGLWWADDMDDFLHSRKERWLWTYMILQPDFVSRQEFDQVVDELTKQGDLPALGKIRLETFEEGLAAQILHIGSWSEEGPNIQRIHAHIHAQGGDFDGHKEKHHEIYLSDPRRSDPNKMKTVVRQPFHQSS